VQLLCLDLMLHACCFGRSLTVTLLPLGLFGTSDGYFARWANSVVYRLLEADRHGHVIERLEGTT